MDDVMFARSIARPREHGSKWLISAARSEIWHPRCRTENGRTSERKSHAFSYELPCN